MCLCTANSGLSMRCLCRSPGMATGVRKVSFQKDAARLGCVPGGTQVEDLGSFHNEAGEGWHLKGAGDAVLDVVIETDAQFGSGRCQRHERVPGRGALTG